MPDEKYVGVTATALVLKVYAEYLRLRRKQWARRITKKRAIKLMMSYGYSRDEARRMQGLARCLGKTNASVTETAMWMWAENGGMRREKKRRHISKGEMGENTIKGKEEQ